MDVTRAGQSEKKRSMEEILILVSTSVKVLKLSSPSFELPKAVSRGVSTYNAGKSLNRSSGPDELLRSKAFVEDC
jgi:hypothetical protein